MTQHARTIPGYRRIGFDGLQIGHSLALIADGEHHPRDIGVVVEAIKDPGGTCRVVLDTGTRMTRKGWRSRSIWRRSE